MIKIYERLLAVNNKRHLTGREIARILGITDRSRRVTLSRLVKREVLRRLRRDLYELVLKPSDILEAANAVYRPSYLSFVYGLGKLGILNQKAYEVEFATPKKTKHVEIRGRPVVFRKIDKRLFFGYVLKDNIYIAEPEKALLDTLYLKSKGLADINYAEMNLGGLSKEKLIKMSKKFPSNVQKETQTILLRVAPEQV
jgi:predicted transcriptional regulator of viral defense system